jgi:PAS domain S-box-containing protein
MYTKELSAALGKMSPEFLIAVLDTLPVEFTVLDSEDNVVFWNRHGARFFQRRPDVIGRDVRICHPAKSQDLVNKVIQILKSGKQDRVDFWVDSPDGTSQKLLIRYYAVRSQKGDYLGMIETTTNITPLQGIEGENLSGTFEQQ